MINKAQVSVNEMSPQMDRIQHLPASEGYQCVRPKFHDTQQ